MIQKIGKAAEQKQFIIGTCLNLLKAFDCIDHGILLNKLEQYGIRGHTLKWFDSYLSSRRQYVTWENKDSSMLPNNIGFPQGSILGPLLFIIFVNDLPQVSTFFDYVCFVDDTNVFSKGKDINLLIYKVN